MSVFGGGINIRRNRCVLVKIIDFRMSVQSLVNSNGLVESHFPVYRNCLHREHKIVKADHLRTDNTVIRNKN